MSRPTAKGVPNGLATLDENGLLAQGPGEAAQAAAVADLGALGSAAIAGGESPTEAEHNTLRADVAAIHAKLNALLDSLRDAGIIAT